MVETPIKMKCVLDRSLNRSNPVIYEGVYKSYSIALDKAKSGNADIRLNEEFLNKCRSSQDGLSFVNEVFKLNENLSNEIKENFIDKFCESVIPYINDLDSLSTKVESSNSLLDEEKEKINKCISENCKADKIINNHTKLQKIFNINNFVESHRYAEPEEIIYGICERVETFNIPRYSMLNIALEETLYLNYRHGLIIPRKDCLESVVDYFLYSSFTESDLSNFEKVLNKSICISESDTSNISFLFESTDFADSNDVREMINAFKKDEKKNVSKLEKIVRKAYSKGASNIIDDTPSLFSVIRNSMIIALFPVAPVLSIITFMADKAIQLGVRRKEADRLKKCFVKEKDKTNALIKRTNDLDKVERLEKYIDCINKCIEKLEFYTDSLYSEKENETRWEIEEAYSTNPTITLEKFKLFKFENLFNMARKANRYIEGKYDEVKSFLKSKLALKKTNRRDSLQEDLVNYINNDGIIDICIESFSFDDENKEEARFEAQRLCDELSNSLINPNSKNNTFYYEMYGNTVEIRLTENTVISLTEAEEKEIANMFSDMDLEKVCDIQVINEYLDKAKTFCESANMDLNTLTESTLMNLVLEDDKNSKDVADKIKEKKPPINLKSIKLALMGLREKGSKLSSKEQQLSRQIDYTADHMVKSIEGAMTNDRREAIIKGSVIPSASKCLKIGIAAAGVAAFTDPVVAVLGLLGGLANSKRLNTKERQLLMDEIEIELKIVDKEIGMAENNDDTNKLRTLMQYKKTLEREYQRLKYNMKVHYKTPMDNVRKTFNKVDTNRYHASLSSSYGVNKGGDD